MPTNHSQNDLGFAATKAIDYVEPHDILRSFLDRENALALLSDGGNLGRFSYLTTHITPLDSLGFDDPRNAKDVLNHAINALTAPKDNALPPFSGGVIGLASFELGARLETLPRGAFRLNGQGAWPELILLNVKALLAFDHHEKSLMAIGRGANKALAQNALDSILADFEAAKSKANPVSQTSPQTSLSLDMIADTPDEIYEAKIATLIKQIHNGDLFQANLARGFTGRLKENIAPIDVLHALQMAARSPFGAYLRLGARCIVSNSPERFINLDNEARLETCPIKGTRPRGKTAKEDVQLAQELSASEKDRAENLMIVDLMRHDLSKVSEIGSVKVLHLNQLVSFSNVHHLVSTIESKLLSGKSAADIIIETFPPGSISGAPKVAALKAIHKLEAPRGPYCGSLFYVDVSGAMGSNVLIRTLAFEADEHGVWHYRVCGGGGIVADSDPVAERQESDTKLSLIRKVLNPEITNKDK